MPNGRCRMHGGPSTGPRTIEGLANSRQARVRHGRYSAARKQLRRQLRWISHLAKVLDEFDEMYRLLLAVGIALQRDPSPPVVAAKCVRVLPLYERYLTTLDAASEIGIETSKRRLQRGEQRLLAVLWAGSGDATSQDLPELLAGKSLGTSLSIFRLLDDSEERVKELVALTLVKIEEGLEAGEMETEEGLEPVKHPDHYTRMLAVGRLCRLFSVMVKRARE